MNDTFLFSVLPVDNTDVPLIGRENEVEKIKNAILKYQNVSIVGDIKVGKTSILKTVEVEIAHDPRFEKVIPVFIDLDKNSYNLEIKELLRRILDVIFESNTFLDEKYSNSNLDKREVFSKIVEYCSKKKQTVLLLFDNFDSITVLKNLTEDFFTFLRGNAIEMGLSIITASRSNLESLCHKGQISKSQFWNIFNPIVTLSVFEDVQHARDLLSRGISNTKTIDIIISLVGVHPAFLKVAANAVIENGLNNSDNESEICSIVYDKIKPYYEKRLKLLQNDENNIDNGVHYKLEYISLLNSICCTNASGEITKTKEFLDLQKRGYVHKNIEGKPEISSPLFVRFLKEKCKKPIPYKGTKPFVFISYAHADRVEVTNILQYLMENKIRFWFDEGLTPGNEWRDELKESIKASHTFLVFVSPHSVLSDYVKKELTHATIYDIKIQPVYLVETNLPEIIKDDIGKIQAIMKYQNEKIFFKTLMDAIDPVCKE